MAMISIVVPVYNVEKYLDNCIDSILNQTYTDYELILVDDGSKDNCPQICDNYAKIDKRIKVLHKDNGGLSDARNAGTELANGKYITYVDGDDYINPLYLEMLFKAVTETKADFSVVDLKNVYSLDEYEKVSKYNVNIKKISAHSALSLVLYQKIHDVSACGILMPLSLAQKHRFPVGKLFEDLFTTYKYYLDVSTVAIVDAKLYCYLQRSNSIMDGNINHRYVKDIIEASDVIVQACEKYPDLIMAANNKKFSNYCSLMAADFNSLDKDDIDNIKNFLNDYKKIIIKDTCSRLKNRIMGIMMFVGIPLFSEGYKIKKLLKPRKIDLK